MVGLIPSESQKMKELWCFWADQGPKEEKIDAEKAKQQSSITNI